MLIHGYITESIHTHYENFLIDYIVLKGKINENETKYTYQDLDRELKKIWNMKMTVTLSAVSPLGIIPKGLVKRLEIRR